ncbi:MAG: multicopper oxidase domain-containing protein [Pseudonocardiales bacterium]|nr:multicopper oxidase domain-containing protein [Pseudonocardiales bacterium]
MNEVQPALVRNGRPGRGTPRAHWILAAVVVGLLAVGCGSGGSAAPAARTRAYFIAADEMSWNYAPAGRNMLTDEPFDATANKYVQAGPERIGATHTKCLYHGYTDATFTHQLPRPADEQYLGLLGPVIRAQVGDTITVTFRNNCSFPASIHAHGVFYDKKDEGAPYNDGRTGTDKAGDAVAPHQHYTYTWQVPERAGPGPMDGSSVMWMYHSHTDEVPDVFSGLMGPIEITARGKARPDGSPNDVDREIFALFMVLDENTSHYLEAQRAALAKPPAADNAEFQESNKMHSINGYVYGNGPLITMHQGERVRWYVMSMGNEVDLHTPHWHGNTVIANGMRTDTVNLLPATMVVADMVPDNPGIWLFHCHVSDHITAGMQTRYQVLPPVQPGSR